MPCKFRHSLLLLLLLVACGPDREPEKPVSPWPGYTPGQTLGALSSALEQDDLYGFFKGLLPPEKLLRWRARWQGWQQQTVPPETAQAYRERVARWQSPDAEATLVEELTPQLRKFQQQLPRLLDVLHASIVAGLSQGNDPLAASAEPLIRIIDRLFLWARNTDFANPVLLRQSVHEIGAMLRDVNLPTLADVKALSFEQALDRSSRVWLSVLRILSIYNIDVKEFLSSMQVSHEEVHGAQARVMVRLDIFGVRHSLDVGLGQRGQRWYLDSVLQGFVPSPSLDERMGEKHRREP